MNKHFVNYVFDSIFALIFTIFGASIAISALGDRNHHVHFTTSQQLNGQLLGGLAAAFASGGDSAATMLASNIALSGMANNRQLHRSEVEWLRNNAQTFADQMGISYEAALAILSAEAASRVDSHYAKEGGNADAAAFLDANKPQGLIVQTIGDGEFVDQNQEWFAATEDQYTNQLINFQTLQGNGDIFKHFNTVQSAQGGDLNVWQTTLLISATVDDLADLSPTQTIAMIRAADLAFASSQSGRDADEQERYNLMIKPMMDSAFGSAILLMDDAAFDALPQADRDYLVNRLVQAYYDIATTVTGGQADGPAFKSTKLTQEVRSRLPVGVAPNGELTTTQRQGILREASQLGQGTLTLAGRATRAEAANLGEAWVGPRYRTASDGRTLVSADGTRTFRPPTPKPNSPFSKTGVQVNFETRELIDGRWTVKSNAHLDVSD